MDSSTKTTVIKKEDAVFFLDKNGRWRNRHGPFQHKKIIDYFHRSIRKDEGGYYLYQSSGDRAEKVYFPCEDVALFVFDVIVSKDGIELALNTGDRVALDPEGLFVKNDSLYMESEGETIKFSERALTGISEYLEFRGDRYHIRAGGKSHEIGKRGKTAD